MKIPRTRDLDTGQFVREEAILSRLERMFGVRWAQNGTRVVPEAWPVRVVTRALSEEYLYVTIRTKTTWHDLQRHENG
jgi:hypothetical protein